MDKTIFLAELSKIVNYQKILLGIFTASFHLHIRHKRKHWENWSLHSLLTNSRSHFSQHQPLRNLFHLLHCDKTESKWSPDWATVSNLLKKEKRMKRSTSARKGRHWIHYSRQLEIEGLSDKVSPRGSHRRDSVTLERLIATHSSPPLGRREVGTSAWRGSRPSRTVISMKIDKSRRRRREEETRERQSSGRKPWYSPLWLVGGQHFLTYDRARATI